MKFSNQVIQKFYEELFSTDFTGEDSTLQNLKTDCLLFVHTFTEWLSVLVREYCNEYGLRFFDVHSSVYRNKKFYELMKEEYEDLVQIDKE